MLVEMARSQAQPGQPSTDDDVPVTEVELARFGRYYGDISTCNKVFHPTAREINLLKACVNDERWKELQDALGKPAWQNAGPNGRRRSGWKRVRLHKEMQDEAAFLKELREWEPEQCFDHPLPPEDAAMAEREFLEELRKMHANGSESE